LWEEWTTSRSARCASRPCPRRTRTSTARRSCAARARSRGSSGACAQYAPPSDLDELDEYLATTGTGTSATILSELRAYVHETATLHAYIAEIFYANARDATVGGIPVYPFAGGVVLGACARTYELRAELRARGGEWRVVSTPSGKVLGWAFPENSDIIETIRASGEDGALQ
jgi:hypothetical protein